MRVYEFNAPNTHHVIAKSMVEATKLSSNRRWVEDSLDSGILEEFDGFEWLQFDGRRTGSPHYWQGQTIGTKSKTMKRKL